MKSLKEKLKKRGSAILIVIVLIGSMVPLALTLTDLDIFMQQGSIKTIDSQLAEAATMAGVNDVKNKIKNITTDADMNSYLAAESSYNVDMQSGKKITSTIDIKTIARNNKLYQVKRNSNNDGKWIFEIEGYYGNVKHKYEVKKEIPDTLTPRTSAAGYVAAKATTNIESQTIDTCASYVDKATKRMFTWDRIGLLRSFDVSDQNKPVLRGTFEFNYKGNPYYTIDAPGAKCGIDMESYNDTLYVIANTSTVGMGKLYVFNIGSDKPVELPSSGISLGYGESATRESGGMAVRVDTGRRLLYIAGFYQSANNGDKFADEVVIYDITIPTAPVARGRVALKNDASKWYNAGGDITGVRSKEIDIDPLNASFVYIADSVGGVIAINTADPTNPVRISEVIPKYSGLADQTGGSIPSGEMDITDVKAVSAAGNRSLYLAAGSGGIIRVNANDPSKLSLDYGSSICAGVATSFLSFAANKPKNELMIVNRAEAKAGVYFFNYGAGVVPTRPYGGNNCTAGKYMPATSMPDPDKSYQTEASQGNRVERMYYTFDGASDDQKPFIGMKQKELFAFYGGRTTPNYLSVVSIAPIVGVVYDIRIGKKETYEYDNMSGHHTSVFDDSKRAYALSSTGIQIIDFSVSDNPRVVANYPMNVHHNMRFDIERYDQIYELSGVSPSTQKKIYLYDAYLDRLSVFNVMNPGDSNYSYTNSFKRPSQDPNDGVDGEPDDTNLDLLDGPPVSRLFDHKYVKELEVVPADVSYQGVKLYISASTVKLNSNPILNYSAMIQLTMDWGQKGVINPLLTKVFKLQQDFATLASTGRIAVVPDPNSGNDRVYMIDSDTGKLYSINGNAPKGNYDNQICTKSDRPFKCYFNLQTPSPELQQHFAIHNVEYLPNSIFIDGEYLYLTHGNFYNGVDGSNYHNYLVTEYSRAQVDANGPLNIISGGSIMGGPWRPNTWPVAATVYNDAGTKRFFYSQYSESSEIGHDTVKEKGYDAVKGAYQGREGAAEQYDIYIGTYTDAGVEHKKIITGGSLETDKSMAVLSYNLDEAGPPPPTTDPITATRIY